MAFVAHVVNTMPSFGAVGQENSIGETFLSFDSKKEISLENFSVNGFPPAQSLNWSVLQLYRCGADRVAVRIDSTRIQQ